MSDAPILQARDSLDDAKPSISYTSAKELMAHGPHVLHAHVASTLEVALGRALPQMEVRVSNVSLSADIVVASQDAALAGGTKTELPTIVNELKKGLAGLVATKQSVRKEILKDVNAVFKPGSITLLLGQPGSGKSSLMKLISGRFPLEDNITLGGNIEYNGAALTDIKKIVPQFVAYVNQRDQHFPSLTVKETLQFAHSFTGGELTRRGEELLCKGTPEENMAALEAARAMFAHYPEIMIQQLGLQHCQDTIVGDAMMRGISGGERKRVTTGEMEFGMKYVTLMDEISTGLDSAATYDIINTQRSIAKTLRKTVVIALLQPAPEVFALFDDVMILNDGEVMYYGPREQVVNYFENLGFACPPERDVADFLLDLGTKEQRRYEVTRGVSSQQQKAPSSPPPRFPSEFAELFRRSAIHAVMLDSLVAPYNPDLLENVQRHMEPTPEFHQSFWGNTRTLVKRELLVQFRNTPMLLGRAIMIVLMGLLYASTFYQFDPTKVQVVMGIIFAAVLFLSLSQMSLIPTFMAARDIFYKQRAANFYRTSSYVLANSLSLVPLAAIETVVFGSLVYWVCGFTSSASAFIMFEVLLLLTNMAFGAWFFFVSSVSPNVNVANPIAMVSILFFILFAGFVVFKSKIPDYFIWLYWLSPISWSVRALAVNQYRSSAFDRCDFRGVSYCKELGAKSMGEYYLGLYDVPSAKEWIVYGAVYLAVLYVAFMGLSFFVLEYKRYESPENVSLTKVGSGDSESDDVTSYVLVSTPKISGSSTLGSSPTDSNANANAGDVVLAVRDLDAGVHEKNFTPVTLAFMDLWYTVPLPSNPKHETIDLLKGITGYALPGTMTALMGSSGAGKTTLMDVIAGRKTGGKIRGQILLNGYAASDLSIRRCTGYCEQMDIHSEASTIREALTFSAFLRQDASVPASKKFDSVNECLDLLDMHGIADQIIRGSSVEQMKRLTIGVELAAQPSVLFLDEPTSGLDARSAKLIMDGVRKVANSGRTIVCTIHQPSSEVFFLFDKLLLLKRGGETVFFGDLGVNCRNLIGYFQAVPGAPPLPHGYNPATWMLECIGAGVGGATAPVAVDDVDDVGVGRAVDFVQHFANSEQKRLLDATIAQDGVGHAAAHTAALMFSQKRAASSQTQMRLVVGRFLDLYWRTASYNLTRIFMSFILALLFGLVFIDADYDSYQGTNSGIGMVGLVLVFNGLVSMDSVIPVASHERASFYRERASQTYNALWYFVGSTLAEIPYVFLSGLLFTAIFFPMVGFTGVGTFMLFWLNISLLILYHAYLGQLLAYALPSEEVATIIGVLVTSICFLFMGFNPPTSSIPSGFKWLYHITPHTYSLAIGVALVFADCPSDTTFDAASNAFVNVGSQLGCKPLANAPVTMGVMTVKEFTEQVFRIKHDEIAQNFVVVVAFTVLFRVLALLALRFVNHQKK